MDQTGYTRQVRTAGAVMVAAVAGVVFGMAHHPTHVDAASAGPVHGGLLALLVPLAWGMAVFALVRGASRPLVLLGLIAFAGAQIGHITAATINGFAAPAFAARDVLAAAEVLLLAFDMNRAFAGLGVMMTAFAFACWGLDLLRDPRADSRITGAVGLFAAAASAFLLGSGQVGMDLAGATLLYAIQFGWTALVGVQLARGKLGRGEPVQRAGT